MRASLIVERVRSEKRGEYGHRFRYRVTGVRVSPMVERVSSKMEKEGNTGIGSC